MSSTLSIAELRRLRQRAEGFRHRLAVLAKAVDEASTGRLSRYIDLDPDLPTFATILDEFSHDCFAPDLNEVPLSRMGWRQEVQDEKLDALFVESAWVGNRGDWQNWISQPDRLENPLNEILLHCRENRIPSVFWNKEDPVHFDKFLETAKRFDFIFTTDIGCVDRYRQATGRGNAHLLPFAAQPAFHNPTRRGDLKERVAFTGSWRGIRYPKRAEWLETLLTPALERDMLDIFDRNDGRSDPDLVFPEKFQPAIRGGMPYRQLVEKVHKHYLAFVNVNSVEDSDTMLARRVFEFLACGVPVISSHSRAMERTFADVVIMPETSRQAGDEIDRLRTDPVYRASLAARGVRLVHSKHTYRHRVEEISRIIGRPFISRPPRKVALICSSKRPQFLQQAAHQMRAQTYEEREIIFIAHSDEFRDEEIDKAFGGERKLTILRADAANVLADNLNLALSQADSDFFAKMDDDDLYAPHYIEDSMRCFDYDPSIGVVGKNTYFTYLEALDRTVCRFPNRYYRFSNHVAGATLVVDRRKIAGITFRQVVRGTDSLFIKDCIENGIPIFSTDPFNFLNIRSRDPDQHTWNISAEEFASKTVPIGPGKLLDKVFL